MSKLIDITGKQMGDWTIIKKIKVSGISRAMFLCRCKCGIEKEISGNKLRKGNTKHYRCNKRKVSTKESFYKDLIYKYRSGAKNRNYEFSLLKDEFIEITKQNCVYCGAEPSNSKTIHEDTFYYSGLDRINNNLGYVKTNVSPCCIQCNQAKSNLTQKQFKQHVLKIAKHLNIL